MRRADERVGAVRIRRGHAAVDTCRVVSHHVLSRSDSRRELPAVVTTRVCPSPTSCVAAGYYQTESGDQTLIESWDGSTWALTSSPNAGGSNELEGVSCPTSTSCVAVGHFLNGPVDDGHGYQTLIETSDMGAWSVTSSPNVGSGTSDSSALHGVSCFSSASCVAVGYDDTGSGDQALIETWDGSTWSVTSSPAHAGALGGVSCSSSTSCVAVGSYTSGSGIQILVETWNGSAWSITSTPNASGNDGLGSVSCTSSTSCVAVGSSTTGSEQQYKTLIDVWNGSHWSIVSSPDASTSGNTLLSVSCSSSTSCEAVGYYDTGSGDDPLIEIWNGTSWGIASGTNRGGTYIFLDGVSCTERDKLRGGG